MGDEPRAQRAAAVATMASVQRELCAARDAVAVVERDLLFRRTATPLPSPRAELEHRLLVQRLLTHAHTDCCYKYAKTEAEKSTAASTFRAPSSPRRASTTKAMSPFVAPPTRVSSTTTTPSRR